MEVTSCYEGLDVRNANKFKYLELIGKVKGFLEPISINTFVFTGMDKDSIMSRIQSISSKVINSNKLQSIGSLPSTLHNVDYKTLKKENKAEEVMPIDTANQASQSHHIDGEPASLILSTPPPVNPNISTQSKPTTPTPDTTPEPLQPQGEEDKPDEPTWIGCKHNFVYTGENWVCSKCNISADEDE